MKEAKSYRTEVRTDAGYDEIPEVATFSVDEDTAREIVKLAAIVKANGLHKVEKFDYRTNYLKYDPAQNPDDAEEAGDENDVRTEADTINVSETEFWFAAYLKHTDVEVLTERQRIEDLLAHFGIRSEPTKSSVPVKYWDCYNSEYPTANTHQFDVDDQRNTNGQMYMDIGAIDGNLDDLMSVTMEVNTNPLNGIDHVPCAYVHFDGDNLAVSLFKIGDKILVRPETDVTIEQVRDTAFGVPETMYWIE